MREQRNEGVAVVAECYPDVNGRVHEDQGFVRRWMKVLGTGLWLTGAQRQNYEQEGTEEKSMSRWCWCDSRRMGFGEGKAQIVRVRKDASLNWTEGERWDRRDGDRQDGRRRSEVWCEDAVAAVVEGVVVVVVGRRSH